MSENLIVALIGLVGTLMGAVIGAILQRGAGPVGSKWIVTLLTGGGLLVGLLVGLVIARNPPPAPLSPQPSYNNDSTGANPSAFTWIGQDASSPSVSEPPTATPPSLPTPTPSYIPIASFGPDPSFFPAIVQASVQNMYVEHDVVEQQRTGMRAVVTFTVDNMKDIPGAVQATVSYNNGEPLQGFAPTSTINGNLGVEVLFTPAYNPQTLYENLALFLPYDEFYMLPGTYDLVLNVAIVNQADGTVLATATPYPFTFTEPTPANNVSLDVSGDWIGTIEYVQLDGSKTSFLFSMNLSQTNSTVTGTSSIIAPSGETAKMSVQGSVTGSQFTFGETDVQETNAPNGYQNSGGWCLKQGALTYQQGAGNFSQIEGLSGAINSVGCFPGTINLLRAKQ